MIDETPLKSFSADMNRLTIIIAVLLLLAALGLTVIPPPPVDNAAPRWLDKDSAAAVAYARFQKEFGADEVFVVQLKAADPKTVLRYTATVTKIFETDSTIERVISVKSVLGPGFEALLHSAALSPEKMAAAADSPLNRALHLFKPNVASAVIYGLSPIRTTAEKASLEDALAKARRLARDEGVTMRFAGNPLVNSALDRAGEDVERKSMPLLVGICFLLMLLLTRSLPVALISLVPAGLVVKAAEGAVGFFIPSTNIVVNIAKPLIFVLLFAATVHLITAWQEARRNGISAREAPTVARLAKQKGIVLALLTTAVGFGSLVFSDVPPIRHFGLVAACGLAAGILYVLGLFPVLLRFVPVPSSKKVFLAETAWRAVRLGLKGRAVAPILALLVIIGGFVSAFYLRSDPHAIHYFPPHHPLREDHELLEADGLGLATAEVIVRRKTALLTPDGMKRLTEFSAAISRLHGVKAVVDPTLAAAEARFQETHGTLHDNMVSSRTPPSQNPDLFSGFSSNEGKDVRLSVLIGTLDAFQLSQLKRDITQEFEHSFSDAPKDTTVEITGNYQLLLSTQAGLLQTLQSSLLLTAVIMALFFAVFLKSVPVALLAMIPNLLPVCVNFLLMYALRMPLDVGTSMTAAIALGIAVDDTLHFCLAWDANDPKKTARRTGHAIILSSIVISAGFLSLMVSDFIPTRHFGLLSGAAMISALIADLTVMPPLLAWVSTKQRKKVSA